MQVSPERAEAIELEQKILACWQATGGSRHISEVASLLCGRDWDFTIKPLIGGAFDVEVQRRERVEAPPGATLTPPRVIEADEEGPRVIAVALVWAWPDGEPPDLQARIQAWWDEVSKKGTFP